MSDNFVEIWRLETENWEIVEYEKKESKMVHLFATLFIYGLLVAALFFYLGYKIGSGDW